MCRLIVRAAIESTYVGVLVTDNGLTGHESMCVWTESVQHTDYIFQAACVCSVCSELVGLATL